MTRAATLVVPSINVFERQYTSATIFVQASACSLLRPRPTPSLSLTSKTLHSFASINLHSIYFSFPSVHSSLSPADTHSHRPPTESATSLQRCSSKPPVNLSVKMPEKAVDLELIVLTILAILSPIVCVFLIKGCCGTLFVTFLLTALMFVSPQPFTVYPLTQCDRVFPGIWHALYIVSKHHKRQQADRATSSVQVIQTVPQNSGSGMTPAPMVRVITSPPANQTIQPAPATQSSTQTIQAAPSPVEQVVVTAPVVPIPAPR